jgi:hypothetical protein
MWITKQAAILDYDDLLLFWHCWQSLSQAEIRAKFDCVLVDEYQVQSFAGGNSFRFVNRSRLTVVGDLSRFTRFRASMRNIWTFPNNFRNDGRDSEQNIAALSRSRDQCGDRRSCRAVPEGTLDIRCGEAPELVTCDDENDQSVPSSSEYSIIAGRYRFAQQTVLFRHHHSILLSRCRGTIFPS